MDAYLAEKARPRVRLIIQEVIERCAVGNVEYYQASHDLSVIVLQRPAIDDQMLVPDHIFQVRRSGTLPQISRPTRAANS
jgi:hypothetical protein